MICRFVYLLQALSALTQQMLVRAGEDVIDQRTSSIGLVVKQFCNRQVQLNTVVQQTMSDVSQYATNLRVTIYLYEVKLPYNSSFTLKEIPAMYMYKHRHRRGKHQIKEILIKV